jgi:hypothetical protein
MEYHPQNHQSFLPASLGVVVRQIAAALAEKLAMGAAHRSLD